MNTDKNKTRGLEGVNAEKKLEVRPDILTFRRSIVALNVVGGGMSQCHARPQFFLSLCVSAFFLLFLLYFGQAYSSPLPLTFQELLTTDKSLLSSFHNREVQINGFLYQGEGSQWILSPEPNLKSCCVGADAKVMQQIVLRGSFDQPSPSTTVKMQGKLTIRPKHDSTGNLTQFYLLENAKIIPEPSSQWPLRSIIFALICLGTIWAVRRYIGSIKAANAEPKT